jgi:VanZ family protein
LKFKHFIPAIAWFLLLSTLLFTPGNDLPQIDFIDELNLDKLIHMTLFGTLTLLFCLPFRKSAFDKNGRLSWFTKIALSASIWGITTEVIQKYIPGRSFEWLDWAADSAGALCGYILSRFFFIKKAS